MSGRIRIPVPVLPRLEVSMDIAVRSVRFQTLATPVAIDG